MSGGRFQAEKVVGLQAQMRNMECLYPDVTEQEDAPHLPCGVGQLVPGRVRMMVETREGEPATSIPQSDFLVYEPQ